MNEDESDVVKKDDTILPAKNEIPKKKLREERASKVVVRKLPPTMTEEEFLEQVSPLPENNYINFVPADELDECSEYSRAYINFVNTQDVVIFSQQFDGYVFLDSKGEEYPSVVELAPFQRIPKQQPNMRRDRLCATIKDDPKYILFLEEYLSADDEGSQAVNENFYDLTEEKSKHDTELTPLMEYIVTRNKEWLKQKEERKEERRRKELERKKLKEEARQRAAKLSKETSLKEEKLAELKEKDKSEPRKDEDKSKIKRAKGGKSYQEERMKELEKKKNKTNKESAAKEEKKDITESTENGYDKQEETSSSVIISADDDKKPAKVEAVSEAPKKEVAKKTEVATAERKECYANGFSDNGDYEQSKYAKKSAFDSKFSGYSNTYGKKYSGGPRGGKSYSEFRSGGGFNGGRYSAGKDSSFDNRFRRGGPSKRGYYGRRNGAPYFEDDPYYFDDDREDYRYSGRKPIDAYEAKKKALAASDGYNTESVKGHAKKESSQAIDSDVKKTSNDTERRASKRETTERKTKNKDRPALQIYRPGMGKYSRQKFEQMKTEGDSPQTE